MTTMSTLGGSAEQASWHKKPAHLYPPINRSLIAGGTKYLFGKEQAMNAHEALKLIEYQVLDFYDLAPELRDAIATLSAALDERDALRGACELVVPAMNSLLTEFISKTQATDWGLVNDCLCRVAHVLKGSKEQ